MLNTLTKEQLQELCDKSSSIKEVLEKLNLAWNGSANYKYFYNTVDTLEIDLTKLKSNKPEYNMSFNKKHDSEIFCENSKVARHHVKKRVIRDNLIEYKCRKCGLGNEWQDEEISLQLEHKNGINDDNRLENLEFLCPNCHSQTKTYGGKKKKKKKAKNMISEKHLEINEERRKFVDSINTEKVGWVKQAAEKWNISHTSVKRWVKKYYPELKYYERKS